MLPRRFLQRLLGLLPRKLLCSQLPQQLRESVCLPRHPSIVDTSPIPFFSLRPLQISVFIFIAIYIITSYISGWKFKSFDQMDFSEMDAIREERAWNEANPKPKMSWYRSLVEKVTDE